MYSCVVFFGNSYVLSELIADLRHSPPPPFPFSILLPVNLLKVYLHRSRTFLIFRSSSILTVAESYFTAALTGPLFLPRLLLFMQFYFSSFSVIYFYS